MDIVNKIQLSNLCCHGNSVSFNPNFFFNQHLKKRFFFSKITIFHSSATSCITLKKKFSKNGNNEHWILFILKKIPTGRTSWVWTKRGVAHGLRHGLGHGVSHGLPHGLPYGLPVVIFFKNSTQHCCKPLRLSSLFLAACCSNVLSRLGLVVDRNQRNQNVV